jgi:CBS domain-containing protein
LHFISDVMRTDVHTFDVDLPASEALASIAGTDPERLAARRQLLYPVVVEIDRLASVVTRTQLETAAYDGRGHLAVGTLGLSDPITAHPDETCRVVALRMAEHGIDRMPVVDRYDRTRVVGMVALSHLLAGRVQDLQEARHAERVLRLRPRTPVNGPRRDSRRRPTVTAGRR